MNREVYPWGPPRCTRWDHLGVPIRNPRTPFFSYSYLLLSSNNKKIEWRSLWVKLLRSLRFMPLSQLVTYGCPLLALRHSDHASRYPLSGVKRTSLSHRKVSASDPKADMSECTALGSRECIATTTAHAEFFREYSGEALVVKFAAQSYIPLGLFSLCRCSSRNR